MMLLEAQLEKQSDNQGAAEEMEQVCVEVQITGTGTAAIMFIQWNEGGQCKDSAIHTVFGVFNEILEILYMSHI